MCVGEYRAEDHTYQIASPKRYAMYAGYQKELRDDEKSNGQIQSAWSQYLGISAVVLVLVLYHAGLHGGVTGTLVVASPG